ncbi:MAG: periplasmic heavy metal sensor [Candidatus Binataceae bacterium]
MQRGFQDDGSVISVMKEGFGFDLRLAIIALVLLTVAMLPRTGSSQMMFGPDQERMEGGMGGGPELPLFLHSAGITPEQREQVKKIMDGSHPAFQALFEQLHAKRQQLDDKLFAPGAVNEGDIAKESAQIGQLQQQLADQELKVVLQIRSLLTPEQLNRVSRFHNRLESLHEQMKELMQENMPPGPSPGPPPG